MSEHVRTNVTYRCKSGDWRIEAGRGRAEICEDRKNEKLSSLLVITSSNSVASYSSALIVL